MLKLKPDIPIGFWNKQGNTISSRGWTKEGFIWKTDLPLFGDRPSPPFVYYKKPDEEFISVVTYTQRITSGSLYRKKIGFIKREQKYYLAGDLSVDSGREPIKILNKEGLSVIPYFLYLPEARKQFISFLAQCIEIGPDILPKESVQNWK